MTESPNTVALPWSLPAPELPPDMVKAAVGELRCQVRTDQVASRVAGTIIAVLGVAVGEYWAVALGGLVLVMAGVRLLARPALDRSDLTAAVAWNAAGTWLVAIAVVAFVPAALPIMVLNLVGPLFTAAIYLDAGATRRLTYAGVGVALALGLIGFRTDGVGLGDGAPTWLFQLVMIGYLAAHVLLMNTLVGTSNRVRLDVLRRALAADAELEHSRNRAVVAADAERVRIERNIHDGAQQRLLALAVQLKLAADLARAGTPVDPDQVDDLHDKTRVTIDELRELARGTYPTLLADRGLAGALRGVAERSQQPVTIDCDDALGLEAATETAVYFVCTEAMQNVAKHAGAAATAGVEVRRAGDLLTVTISDDGAGFDVATARHSRGLLNMRDRVATLGGDLSIDSRPGEGTRLTATVPLEGGRTDRAHRADGRRGDPQVTRVVVAEDHLLMRQGIVSVVEALGDTEIVDECAAKDELLASVARHRPDLVITDIRMPPTHTSEGVDAASEIRRDHPGTAVIVLTHHNEPHDVIALFEGSTGGVGYLLKENIADLDELRRAIATVCSGGSPIDPEVVAAMAQQQLATPSRIDRLTPREREVLALIAEGLNNSAIAAELVIAEKSVHKHINTIFSKLGLTEEPDTHRRVRAVRLWLADRSVNPRSG